MIIALVAAVPLAVLVGYLAGTWHSARTLPRRLAQLTPAQVRQLGEVVDAYRGRRLPPADHERPSVPPVGDGQPPWAAMGGPPPEPDDWQGRRPPAGTMLPTDPPGRWSRGS